MELKRLFIVHLFLNLYLVALVQPVLPILDYLLHYDFISQQLCENKEKPILTCNGKCYVGKQIAEKKDLDRSADKRLLPPKVEFKKLLMMDPPEAILSFLITGQRETRLEDVPNEYSYLATSYLLRPPIA